MDLLRIQATSLVTLTHTFRVDGTATDCSGNVTVTVKRLDGSQISGSPFTATHGNTGVYTFQLPAQANVDMLTADWVGSLAGATVVLRDYVEIVGGFYFGLDEARAAVKGVSLRSPVAISDADLVEKRTGVEQECDSISGHSWVPRFARFLLDGSGTDELVVPDMNLRAVRAASVAASAAGPFTALSAGQLAALAPEPSGVIVRDDGDVWPKGRRNVVVEYEHGSDMPTIEVHDAALLRLKSFVNRPNSGIPDRALQYTAENGTTYRLTSSGPKSTGIPDVDAAYRRDTTDKFWIAR